jgi:lipoate-protein ligase B
MQRHFLGLIPFQQALHAQQEAWANCYKNQSDMILGFETPRTITLGVRGTAEDLLVPTEHLKQQGFEVHHLDRAGQATLHNPGQLVIFPVVNIRDKGVREWVCHLLKTTVVCLKHFGLETKWDEAHPGVYSELGKVASLGVRIRRGISTHGIAINVSNRIEDFQVIRACGRSAAPIDKLGEQFTVRDVFEVWNELY